MYNVLIIKFAMLYNYICNKKKKYLCNKFKFSSLIQSLNNSYATVMSFYQANSLLKIIVLKIKNRGKIKKKGHFPLQFYLTKTKLLIKIPFFV